MVAYLINSGLSPDASIIWSVLVSDDQNLITKLPKILSRQRLDEPFPKKNVIKAKKDSNIPHLKNLIINER